MKLPRADVLSRALIKVSCNDKRKLPIWQREGRNGASGAGCNEEERSARRGREGGREISVPLLRGNLVQWQKAYERKKIRFRRIAAVRACVRVYLPFVYATGDTRRGVEIDATGRNGKRGCSRVDLRSRICRLAVSGVTRRLIGRTTSHACSPAFPSPSPVTNASRPQVRSRGAGPRRCVHSVAVHLHAPSSRDSISFSYGRKWEKEVARARAARGSEKPEKIPRKGERSGW